VTGNLDGNGIPPVVERLEADVDSGSLRRRFFGGHQFVNAVVRPANLAGDV